MQKSKITSIIFSKKPLLGCTYNELKDIVRSLNIPVFTAQQITDWLYKKNVSSIDEMTNISLVNRSHLKSHFCIGKNTYSHKYQSIDGTIKYIFPVSNEQNIETVYIPGEKRTTLCISSQVGCKMNCAFCMTGKKGFKSQLSARSIINQILSIPNFVFNNLVFMGMGEPLDNPIELFRVLNILTSKYGFNWTPKRITVSTVGNFSEIKHFFEKTKVRLAISLHSPFHEERMKWIPIEKTYPITKIISFIKNYNFQFQQRISFEYIAFGRLNDDIKHAEALFKLLKGVTPCRINLIKYHSCSRNNDFPPSDLGRMVKFRNYLNSKGIICTIRVSKGEDICAACGMLSY